LKWQRRSKVPPNARCVPSYDFSTQKGEGAVEIHKQIVAVYGKKFDDDDEVQEEVMTWFKRQAADFYDSGIQKLVPRFNKCLDNADDCVEK
jgi:hypothetical protein